jgi:hypothetical protein
MGLSSVPSDPAGYRSLLTVRLFAGHALGSVPVLTMPSWINTLLEIRVAHPNSSNESLQGASYAFVPSSMDFDTIAPSPHLKNPSLWLPSKFEELSVRPEEQGGM